MNTLDYIVKKYNLNENQKSPVRLNSTRETELPVLFKELGFTSGAEIGVEMGTFSECLIKDNSNLKLYSVDFWEHYRMRRGGKSWPRQNRYYEIAKEKLAPYNCEIIKSTSMEAVKQFADESLDFVYIDANHEYEFVKQDLEEWSKKIKRGGIVSGDDYYVFRSGNDGVIKAVDEWVEKNKIKYLFLFIKTWHPSWFYVKE